MSHSDSDSSQEDKILTPSEDSADMIETSDNDIKPPKEADVKLDELFQTDDEDDEFSSSYQSKSHEQNTQSSPPPAELPTKTANYSDPEVMLAFYQRLFPFKPLYQWLNHSIKPSSDFAHREFAFVLQNAAYIRYQSYPTAELFRKDVCRLNPTRFEIGPVYSTNPRDRKVLRKATTFKPLNKELVFDIDLTDYDDIRTCCSEANICHKCWRFVTMAIKVVDAALREDFGFEHIMWVYSGRRGAHAWVSDKKAREMDDAKRRALMGYLEVIKGGSQAGKKVNLKRPLHPHIVRSLDILQDHFQTDILEDQNPWAPPDRTEALLSLLPDKHLVDALRKKWDSAPGRSSSNKWADIDTLAKSGVSRSLDAKALLEAKKDIILEYTYPQLDVEVSKKQIHLLKSPFVIHPKTGRVCVPIDTKNVERFDPFAVPTVTDLLKEIDEWDKEKMEEEGDGEKVQDYEKTSLKPFVEYFKGHVQAVLRGERGVKREREEDGDAMEF